MVLSGYPLVTASLALVSWPTYAVFPADLRISTTASLTQVQIAEICSFNLRIMMDPQIRRALDMENHAGTVDRSNVPTSSPVRLNSTPIRTVQNIDAVIFFARCRVAVGIDEADSG